jgi:quinol monooxygenase YgiN
MVGAVTLMVENWTSTHILDQHTTFESTPTYQGAVTMVGGRRAFG